MSMKVQFEVTRKTGRLPAGTMVECLMRFCKKVGKMEVTPVGKSKPVQIQRSRLEFKGYVRPQA